MCTQVPLPITTGRFQRLSESPEILVRRGQLHLRQGSTGVEYLHGGRNSRPPGAQALVTPDPCGHTNKVMTYGTEVTIVVVGEAPIHAPRGDRGGGTPLLYLTCSIPGVRGGRGGPSLASAVILLQDRGLAGTTSVNGSPARTSGRYHPSRTHPFRVLRSLRPRGRGRVAGTRQVWPQFGMVSPLAAGHHHRFSLVNKS